MDASKTFALAFASLVLSLSGAACGGSSNTAFDGGNGSDVENQNEGGSHKDGGGQTDSGSSKDGGNGRDAAKDAPSDGPTVNAQTAQALTAAGGYSSSTHYVLFGALGQAPGGNASSQSTKYQLQGGVVGATQ
jgi:hypothetical protein